MREYIDVVIKNSTLESAHIFMHHFANVFNGAHAKESCINYDIVKPKSFFIDNIVTNSKEAIKFQELNLPLMPSMKQIWATNKAETWHKAGGSGSSRIKY